MPPVIAAGAAIVSWIGGAGSAVSGAVASTGAIAATGTAATVISSAVSSAIVGAAVGAATSAIKGENIINGALMGAGVGFAGGALVGGLGAAANALEPAASGVQATTGIEAATAAANPAAEAGAATKASESALSMGGSTPTIGPTVQAANALKTAGTVGASVAKETPSLFGSEYFKQHGGEIIGSTIGMSGQALIKDRTSKDEIEGLMNRDRLLIDSKKIKGLQNIKTPVLPSISPFTKTPKWQDLFQS